MTKNFKNEKNPKMTKKLLFSTRFLALPEASRTLPEAPKRLSELPKAQNGARLEHVENEKNVGNLKSSFVREQFLFFLFGSAKS